MKKKLIRGISLDREKVRKIWMTMRLIVFLFFVSLLHVSASVYSQKTKLNIKVENASLQQVFKVLQEQSEFDFFYKNEQIPAEARVSVQYQNEAIEVILDKILSGTGLTYHVLDKDIVITAAGAAKSELNLQQQKSVSGKVTDSSGAPLPGVSVVVKGTANGSITDSDGNYSLSNVPENATLQFSFVGMKTREVTIAGKTSVNTVLEEETIGIDEVVAVGYGTMKKSDLTGSISQIKSESINSFPATNVMQALSGKTSGVQVLQNTGAPGASMSVRIRGANSIQGSNEPLYVIDGFPVSNQTLLNNSDIESIEILKDASATAIYGSRGANGVILITTKHGKDGQTNIDFESSQSSQSLIRKLDLMNAKEYATFYNIQQMNDIGKEYFTQSDINGFGNGTDWQDVVFRNAPMTTTSLNINGGNNKTRFSISGSTLNQQGIIKGSDYDRYSVRTNVDHEFSKKFSATLTSNFTRLDTDRKDSDGGARGNSLISSAISSVPTLSPYKEDGTYRELAIAYPFVATDLINPLNYINEQSNHIRANIALLNAALVFKPIEELSVKISGGIENRDDRTDSYTSRNFIKSAGSASVSTTQYTSLLSENTISYTNSFSDIHNVSGVAGFTYQDFITTSLLGSGSVFLSDNFETYNLSAAGTPGIPGSSYSKSTLMSYLGRINYNFKNKYFATVSFRADGSSKFSEGNKWGYFPSVALAWRVSDENFLKGNSVISNLKLRSSWGVTGSQAIGPYVTLSQLYSWKTVFNDALYTTFSPGSSLPGDLKWETTEQMDFGFDLGLMDNRFMITADYYVKNTKDLLNTVTLPSSMGFTSTIQNVGEVQNKGFELGFGAKLLTGAFKWDMDLNISSNHNKVVKLYNGEDILGGFVHVVAIQDNINILREGQPIGRFFGYQEDDYDDLGHIKYKDLNPDGKLTSADKTYIGDPNPDFICGLNSNMSFRDFELNIFLQGTYGNDLFNVSAVGYAADYGFGLNMLKEVLDNHWTPTNTNAKYPIISNKSTVNVSDRFVEDGSFLRVKNVQLAYNAPVNSFGLKWIKSLQLYVSGQNLLTLTKYNGWDPEVNSMGGASSTVLGVDNKVYPMSKTMTIGIRARF